MRTMRLGTVGGLSVSLLMRDAYVGAMAMSVESNGWTFRSIDTGGFFEGFVFSTRALDSAPPQPFRVKHWH